MSTQKGTGWVPDFPDVKDYTLSHSKVQTVVDTAGSETVASSLQNLAGRTTETFRAILEHVDAETSEVLHQQIQQVEKEFLSQTLSFRPVRVHQYLTEGVSSPEVLRVKAYLREFVVGLSLKSRKDKQLLNIQNQEAENTIVIKQLIEDVKADVEWWFQPHADLRFSNLLRLYQTYHHNNTKDKNDHKEQANNRLEILSNSGVQSEYPHPTNNHRVDGVLDPETLALFETEPTRELYEAQLDEVATKIKTIETELKARNRDNNCDDISLQSSVMSDQEKESYPVEIYSGNFIALTQRIRQKIRQKLTYPNLPSAGVELIKEFETLSLKAQKLPPGIWTIGYGHTQDVHPDSSITLLEAEDLLLQDLKPYADAIRSHIKVEINENQFGALLSFVYNVGIGALTSSTLLKHLNAGEYDKAAEEFERWSKAGGQELPGLLERRKKEKALFNKDTNSQGPEQLILGFQAELEKLVNDAREQLKQFRRIQIKRLPLSWHLPDEVSDALSAAVFKVIRETVQNDKPISVDAKELVYLRGEAAEDSNTDASNITDQDIDNCKETFEQLFVPVVQAMAQVLAPMGCYKTIHRAIAQTVETFQAVLQQPDLVGALLVSSRPSKQAIEQADEILQLIRALKPNQDPIEQADEILKLLTASLLKVEILSHELFEQSLKKFETCQDALEKVQRKAAEAAKEREEYEALNITQTTNQVSQAENALRQAQQALTKQFIALKVFQRFMILCPIGKQRWIDEKNRLDAQQPTLLYVPMADADSTSHETSLLNRYSDAVQIPIKGSQREQNQRFFGVPANLGDQEHTETWLYLALPEFVDLSYWCSAIEDQGMLNTCTAQAGIALVEYFARKTFNRHENLSARFLYKAARNLMHRTGDTGASVRETMRAMVLFGIPPEEYWPYTEHADKFDHEPNQFCYAYAQNYQAVKYCRLDHAGISKPALLAQIKAVLVSGVPCMFGFTVYNSIYEDFNFKRGHVPYPGANDEMAGGHAVVAVGYDDHRIIESADGMERSQGAILIRNSWGDTWGQGGYGWLPYKYVLAGLTADWWALLKSEWFSKGHFGASIGDWDSHLGGRGGRKKDRKRRP